VTSQAPRPIGDASLPPPARSEQPSTLELEVEEDIIVDEDEEALSSEAPFALNQARPSVPPLSSSPATSEASQASHLATRARQLLGEVDAYRQSKDYDQAIALLFESIEELPDSRDLREKLCDVLIEAGDQPEAVRQMLAFAQWLVSAGDVETATRILDEVLLLEPAQPEAVAMLRELGYTVSVDEAQGDALELEYASDEPAPDSSYDPSAPLPSYDLEEVSPSDAMRHGVHRSFAPSQLDDPFGEAPLPSFALDDDADRYDPLTGARDSAEIAVPATINLPRPHVTLPQAPPPPPSSGQLDEEALEEVEFFASNSMFDEARNVLEEQLGRLPNHPLLLERLRELEEHAAAAQGGGSGTRAVPRKLTSAHGGPPSSFNSDDRAFDIAASLDALDALDAGPQEAQPAPDQDPSQVSADSVFALFKAGVAAQISESDAATHYDLGAAYKEMALFTDAINEFELAARDPGRECVCQWMIGTIHREQGNTDAAIDAFIRGVRAQAKTPDQEVALTYEIGDCYEERRAPDQALYYFQRVARMNPTYNDPRGSIADRVRRLEPAPMPKQPAAKAVGAESIDEFDAVLDDLIGGGKLP